MKLYFLSKRKNNEVASYSDGEIIFDKEIFDLVKIDIAKEEKEKIQSNKYKLFVKNQKIIFEEQPISTEDKIELLEKKVVELENKLKQLNGI